jgi:hypothetical protein
MKIITIDTHKVILHAFTEEEIDNCDEEMPEDYLRRVSDAIYDLYMEELDEECFSTMHQIRVHRIK